MSWKDDLYGKALEIAESSATRLRVMAGPGTGKTFAMKRRIMRLIEEEKVSPDKILTITFTRTVASDLKKELHDLGIAGAQKVKAVTLHSFCFELLSKNEVFERLERVPRPIKSFTKHGYPQFELSPVLSDLNLQGEFGDKKNKFKMIKAFEAAWAKQQKDNVWNPSEVEKKFKIAIDAWLKFHKSILIGELVPLALQYLETNPASYMFDAYSHIIVDEYQDLNKAEQLLIDLLGRNCKLSIVGDIDQSIYSFRYAHPDGIEDFSNRQNGKVEDHSLVECRRCGKNIVHIADALIKNNHQQSSSSRLSSLPESCEGKVVLVQWVSSQDEANGIAEFIKNLIDDKKNGYSYRDILILSPRRLLGYQLRDILVQKLLPVHSFFHEEAVEEKYAQRAVTLLNLLVNPNDSVALRFWLGIGSDNWRAPQYSILLSKASELNITIPNLLDSCISGNIKLKGITEIKKQYEELISIRASLKDKSCLDIINVLFPEETDETKVLREASLLFLNNNQESTVVELWDHIETIITQPETPESGDFIRIMSLHKSKGLTSKVTIITSCVDELIPRHEKDDISREEREYKLQEQRRLFYVALTRAKEILIISSFSKTDSKLAKKLSGKFKYRWSHAEAITSRFIAELVSQRPLPISGSQWQVSGFKL